MAIPLARSDNPHCDWYFRPHVLLGAHRHGMIVPTHLLGVVVALLWGVGCARREDHVQRFGALRASHIETWTWPSPAHNYSPLELQTPAGRWIPPGTTKLMPHASILAVYTGGSYAEPAETPRTVLLFDAQRGELLRPMGGCGAAAATPLGPGLRYLHQAPTMMSAVDAFERDGVMLRPTGASGRMLTRVAARGTELACEDFALHAQYPYLVHVEVLQSGDITVGGCPDELGDRSACVHLWLRVGEPAKVVRESEVVALRAAPARQ